MNSRNTGRSRTLFDPKATCHFEGNVPFFTGVRALADSEDARYASDEAAIFAHVAEHEVGLYEPRGLLCGSLQVRVGKHRRIDISKLEQPWAVPAYVESDALTIGECSASGVLLVQSDPVFMKLFDCDTAQRLNLLLATGFGIPRLAMRRVLYRLCTEVRLPIYVLADSSTWGYFLFSLLKRGVLAPHSYFEYASIRDLRFLGLRAGSIDSLSEEGQLLRPWKSEWELRLRCLKRYPCFKKVSWQRELAAFKKQHGSVTLASAYDSIGDEKFMSTFLDAPLNKRQWLT